MADRTTSEVSLRPVTRENVRAICELSLAEGQESMVAPAAFTVAEAGYEPGSILRAIYLGDRPVGVLLVETETGTPYLVRFMVDASFQRRSVGRQAVELIVGELRHAGWKELEVSYAPIDGGAGTFWEARQFAPTGRETHGEPILLRRL